MALIVATEVASGTQIVLTVPLSTSTGHNRLKLLGFRHTCADVGTTALRVKVTITLADATSLVYRVPVPAVSKPLDFQDPFGSGIFLRTTSAPTITLDYVIAADAAAAAATSLTLYAYVQEA